MYINGSPIKKVPSFKYLGILISDDLSWSKHIDRICAKARRLLGFFYRSFSSSIDSQTFLSFYKTQVLLVLEYGCAVWDPQLTKNIEKLENVQKLPIELHISCGLLNLLHIHPTIYHLLLIVEFTSNYFLLTNVFMASFIVHPVYFYSEQILT